MRRVEMMNELELWLEELNGVGMRNVLRYLLRDLTATGTVASDTRKLKEVRALIKQSAKVR